MTSGLDRSGRPGGRRAVDPQVRVAARGHADRAECPGLPTAEQVEVAPATKPAGSSWLGLELLRKTSASLEGVTERPDESSRRRVAASQGNGFSRAGQCWQLHRVDTYVGSRGRSPGPAPGRQRLHQAIIEGSQRLPWNQRVEARPSNAATRGGIASSRRAVQLLTGKGARAGLWLRKHRKNLVEVATSDAVGRPEFRRDAPGQHRATDITEHSFEEVKVQGWVVLDVHSG